MATALQDHFLQSCGATDESSRAYCAVLKGVDIQASTNAQSHVAFRILIIRFLDICKGLDKDFQIQSEAFAVRKQPNSVSKLPNSVSRLYNVSFKLLQLMVSSQVVD